MYTISNYFKDIHSLTNSLVIKITDVGIAINNGLKLVFDLNPPTDKREWKYYLNMSGQRHFTNSDVKIKLIETNETVSLSKEVLDTYGLTRLELIKYGSYYKELIYKYPNDTGFITGCMLPVDIDKAINSEDGTILNYNKSLVEYNEYSVIRELEIFVKSFLKRWNVSEYLLTDELYIPGLLAIMYSNIPNKINNIRLAKINTNEVHSFHLEHFFRSRMNLWDNIKTLKPSTKMWLYKNLDYILKHVGKQDTFDTILKKIFEENNIGVGAYILDKIDPEILDDLSDLSVSSFKNSETSFIANKLNNAYDMDNNTNLSPNTIVNLELTTIADTISNFNSGRREDVVARCVEKINNTEITRQQTKVLDINTVKLFKRHGVDIVMSIMENWLYLISTDKFVRKTVFIDPNTKLNYDITPKEGYLILLKLLLGINNNINLPISKLSWNKIINKNNIVPGYITSSMFDNGDLEVVSNEILSMLPDDTAYINDSNGFKEYMLKRFDLYRYVWTLDSNAENPIVSANIKNIVDRLYESGEIDFSINGYAVTIDELLERSALEFNIPENYNYNLTIRELFKTFTGIDIDQHEELENNLNNYIQILSKLTSYTVQVIKSIDDSKTIYVPYNHLGVVKSNKGLITVISAETQKPLEEETAFIKAFGNDFRERLQGLYFENNPSVMVSGHINGMMVINDHKELEYELMTPSYVVQVGLNELQTPYTEIEASANDYKDELTAIDNFMLTNNFYGSEEAEDSLIAYTDTLSVNGLVGTTFAPNTIIEIED